MIGMIGDSKVGAALVYVMTCKRFMIFKGCKVRQSYELLARCLLLLKFRLTEFTRTVGLAGKRSKPC